MERKFAADVQRVNISLRRVYGDELSLIVVAESRGKKTQIFNGWREKAK